MLVALLYRLTILQLASRVLPSIGADSWDFEDGVDGAWSDRPVRAPNLRFAWDNFYFRNLDLNVDENSSDVSSIYLCDRLFPSSR